jgi:hypothetical protein
MDYLHLLSPEEKQFILDVCRSMYLSGRGTSNPMARPHPNHPNHATWTEGGQREVRQNEDILNRAVSFSAFYSEDNDGNNIPPYENSPFTNEEDNND